VGGVIVLLFVAPASEPRARDAVRRFVCRFALALAIVQMLGAAESTTMLMAGGSNLAFRDIVAASFFRADCLFAAGALALAFAAKRGRDWTAALAAAVIVGASTALSHAASRVEARPVLLLLTFVHHLGAAAWIGGLASLLVAIRSTQNPQNIHPMTERFSKIAMVSVAALVSAGAGMAFYFIGSWKAMYGTSYGLMVLAKVYLLLLALGLGACNFWLVRSTRSDGAPTMVRLRRFSEVEIGLGVTALLAAASITSQAPAVDLQSQDLLSRHEIVERMSWRTPALQSPNVSELPKAAPLKVHLEDESFSGGSQDALISRKWSEYNHQWAGVIVLAAGLLALLSKLKGQRWARNWPLLFIGLAIFIVVRADADAWPLGPRSFWATFAESDVLQHRLYALLITCFAVFEWAVETGRLKSEKAALVFPALCAAGGALLLTHSHATGNIKDELLAEMSHTPVALLGATAGWGRWLELRAFWSESPNRQVSAVSRIASWMWPLCLALVGLILVNYRET
ncbi:MAG: CopD family protein, partial [Silvibacterium sp.]|nr:CopD family protein [Silvibacterium sp.]